jgi:putative membrane protein insertion efficiency factor
MSAVRRALWLAGAPVRALLIGMIRIYRATLSGAWGAQCRFYPSCSHYAEDAIRTYGAARGSIMAAWRVVRCQPFGRGGFEPVPPGGHQRRYDEVIPSSGRSDR